MVWRFQACAEINVHMQGRREPTLIGVGCVHWIARICYFYKIALIYFFEFSLHKIAQNFFFALYTYNLFNAIPALASNQNKAIDSFLISL